tara:strand:+ start:613 stop:1068 length:456 start_codon:yes stop_codon:yes gene_type:complete
MKSFKKYISEIFDSSKKPYTSWDRKHPDNYLDHSDIVSYRHTIPGVNGEADTQIRTNFKEIDPDHDEYGGAWKAEFSVNGKYHADPKNLFPAHISKIVFDHLNHFVTTREPRKGLVFVTDDPRKSRIYTGVAKKLNVRIRQAKDEESMRME